MKLHKDKHEAILSKDIMRKRLLREQETNLNSGLKVHRNKLNRQRVAKQRSHKKTALEVEEKELPIYNSAKRLCKAVTRAARSLPFSSTKRRLVVGRLAERVGLSKSTVLPSNITPGSIKEKVVGFYIRDDISRQAPGKKDYFTIWKLDCKVQIQNRHLLFTIIETFGIFKEEHPEVKIGRSTFAKLKPLHILHRHELSKDACMYHENVILHCEALHKVLQNFPAFSGDFVGNLVCSTSSELCMMGKCQVCTDKVEQWFGSFKGVIDKR